MKTAETKLNREIVSEAEWLVARKDLLTREKEFTRQRDALSAGRRQLPMVKVEKAYIFDGPKGKETLVDLFGGRSQLIVYHFMFGPDWEEGCKSCSYLADHFDGANWHLPHRDVSLSRSLSRRCRSWKPTKKGWAGASNGCRPKGTISTSTIMSRSRRTMSGTTRRTTTIEPENS
jgi:predicted dithiol-disulfide oxidoreductase (DUF899 family)